MDLAARVTRVADPVRECAGLRFDLNTSVYVVDRHLSDFRFTNEIRVTQNQVIAFRFERLPEYQRVRIYTPVNGVQRFRILILDWTYDPRGQAVMGYLMFENGTVRVSDFRMSLARRRIPDILHDDTVLMIGLRFPFENFVPPIPARINMSSVLLRQENDGNWMEVTDTYGWVKASRFETRVLADPPLLLRPRQRTFETYLVRTGVTVPTATPIPMTLTQESREPEFIPIDQAQADADAWLQALMDAEGFVETPEPMVPLVLTQFAVRRRQQAIERRLRWLNQGIAVGEVPEVPEFVPISSPWMAYNTYMNYATHFPSVPTLVVPVTRVQATTTTTTSTSTVTTAATTTTTSSSSTQAPIPTATVPEPSTSATQDPKPSTGAVPKENVPEVDTEWGYILGQPMLLSGRYLWRDPETGIVYSRWRNRMQEYHEAKERRRLSQLAMQPSLPPTTQVSPEPIESSPRVPVITDTQLNLVDTRVFKRRTHDSDVDREFRRLARIGLDQPTTVIVPQTDVAKIEIVPSANICPASWCDSDTDSSCPSVTVMSVSTPTGDSRECAICDEPLNDTVQETEHQRGHVWDENLPQ